MLALVRNVEHRDCKGRKQGRVAEVGGEVCGGAVIKHFPHSSLHLRVFGKPFPRLAMLQLHQRGLIGRKLGYLVIVANVAHLSLPKYSPISPQFNEAQYPMLHNHYSDFFSTVGFIRYLCPTHGDWLLARLVYFFLSLAPRYYVTYCQARGLSGHTSPCGERVCFLTPMPLMIKDAMLQDALTFLFRNTSGHTSQDVNLFLSS